MAPTRDQLSQSLKDAIGQLQRRTLGVPAEGSAEAQPVPKVLDESVLQVRALISALEQCLFHGLRIEEFKGVFPFWALVSDFLQFHRAEICVWGEVKPRTVRMKHTIR